ncbi:hypothetical protein FQZ97_909980 [compost metagenome]|jgi:hypothetical protein
MVKGVALVDAAKGLLGHMTALAVKLIDRIAPKANTLSAVFNNVSCFIRELRRSYSVA